MTRCFAEINYVDVALAVMFLLIAAGAWLHGFKVGRAHEREERKELIRRSWENPHRD